MGTSAERAVSATMPCMDLQRLREETRAEHEATEAAMPLTEPGLTLAGYTDVLRLLLSVLRGWELWASEAAPAAVRPLLAARRRSHWLEQDLEVLGAAKVSLAFPVDAPIDWSAVVMNNFATSVDTPDEGEAAFLGAFYVMEGSTLGGRFIAKHVERVLKLEPGQGDAYFRGHGEGTGSLWKETTAAIAAVPEDQAEIVIGAARRTFQAFGSVLGRVRTVAYSDGGNV